MPRVPNLDQPTTSRTTGRMDQVTAPPAQDESGAALASLGSGIAQGATTAMSIFDDIRKRNNAVRVDDAINQLSRAENEILYDEETGMMSLRGRNAFERPDDQDLSDEYGTRLEERYRAISEELGNDAQREAFRRAYLPRDASLRTAASTHQLTEWRSYSESVSTESLQRLGEDAINGDDLEGTIAAMRQHGQTLASIRGEDEAAADRYFRTAISEHVDDTVRTRLAQNDFEGAEAVYDRLAPYMTPESIGQVEARLAPEREYRDVARIADEIMNNVIVERGEDEVGAVNEGDAPEETQAAATPRAPQPLISHEHSLNTRGGRYGDSRDGGRRAHAGEDFLYPVGTPVRSEGYGRVVQVQRGHPQAGNWVAIEHGNGVFSRYLHLSDINVSVGDIVDRNSVFARSGDTGTGGPHLHREFRQGGGGGVNGRRINPANITALAPYDGDGAAGGQSSRGRPSLQEAIENARAHPELQNNPARRDAVVARIERQYAREEQATRAQEVEARDAVLEFYQANPNARWEDVPADLRRNVAASDVAGLMGRGDYEENRQRSRRESELSDITYPQRLREAQQRQIDGESGQLYDAFVSIAIENPVGFANADLDRFRGENGLNDADYLRLRTLRDNLAEDQREAGDPWSQVRAGRTAISGELAEADLNESQRVSFDRAYAQRVLDARRANGGRELTEEQLRTIGIDLLGRSGQRTWYGASPSRNFSRGTEAARVPSYNSIPAAARVQIRNDLRRVYPGAPINDAMVIAEYVRRVRGTTR